MAENPSVGELRSQSSARRFVLIRNEDVSGVSGTGIVGEGVQFSNGKVAMTWFSHLGSVTTMDNMEVLKKTSVHKGNTKIMWLDEEEFESIAEPEEKETDDDATSNSEERTDTNKD
jgi:hypothetical protein